MFKVASYYKGAELHKVKEFQSKEDADDWAHAVYYMPGVVWVDTYNNNGKWIWGMRHGEESRMERRLYLRKMVDELIDLYPSLAAELYRNEDKDESHIIHDIRSQLYKVAAMLKAKDGEEIDENDEFWMNIKK
jgi:hypothetical protein